MIAPTRTIINTPQQITFCNSPIHLRLQNTATDSSIKSAIVYLWVWNGAQNQALGQPNVTLSKDKISLSDKYINFQIADYIKSLLVSPINAPNTNQPTFAYNVLSNPAITGQGVFWQISTEITSENGTVINNYKTNFATLGYRWNYEQGTNGNNGIQPYGANGFSRLVTKWYNPKIHNYISQSFNLTNPLSTATSANMITMTSVTPPTNLLRCSRDSALIVYLNKLGLWEMFTPNGKIVISDKTSSETTNRSFRDPSQIDNSFTHSSLRGNLDVLQSYTVNTGALSDQMTDLVEEIIYSPKIYFIRFKGDVQEATTVGITIDNTLVSIDNINITIDSQTVGAEFIGIFKTHQQIPVVLSDQDFTRKNRVNDKTNIDFNLKFDETNNKLLDIR